MLTSRRVLNLLLAALFTLLFFAADWRSINPFAFPDLDRYREGFTSGWYYYLVVNTSPIDFFISEGAWVYLFNFILDRTGDMDVTFSFISISAIFLTSLYVVNRSSKSWPLLFFINPAYINLTIEQIRSGLAIGIFLTAALAKNWPLRIALVLFAASIHTAFFLMGGFLIVYELMKMTRPTRALFDRPWVGVAAVTFAALLVTIFRSVVLAAIGDERASLVVDYASNILLCAAWLTFIVSYLMFRIKDRVTFDVAFLTFNLTMAFFSALLSEYGTRFTAIAIPSLAVMATNIDPRYRALFLFQYIAFTAIYFFYWFR